MNWSYDVVEKARMFAVATAMGNPKAWPGNLAEAALSAITLQDIAKLPDVKALHYWLNMALNHGPLDSESYRLAQKFCYLRDGVSYDTKTITD